MKEEEIAIELEDQRTLVEIPIQTVIGEKKELRTKVLIECKTEEIKGVIVISPGFLQTLEDMSVLPFVTSLTSVLLDEGYLVVKYEDLGIRGKNDPGFMYYSLVQQPATLNTITEVISQQEWSKNRGIFLVGISAGCHTVLNAFPTLSRKPMTIEPAGVVLISPVADIVYDIKLYLERHKPLQREQNGGTVRYLYQSHARRRELEIHGVWAPDTELGANYLLNQLVPIDTPIPTLVIRSYSDNITDSERVGWILREAKRAGEGGTIDDQIYAVDHNIEGREEEVQHAIGEIIGFLKAVK